jgi:DNA polymerase epsilon subunit 1
MLKIEASYHSEAEAAYRAISKELLALQSRRQGATILALCSAKSRTFYESRINALQHYPIVLIPSSKVDNTYPTRLLWQGPAAKRMIQHYLRLSVWLKDRLAMAHHADLPM